MYKYPFERWIFIFAVEQSSSIKSDPFEFMSCIPHLMDRKGILCFSPKMIRIFTVILQHLPANENFPRNYFKIIPLISKLNYTENVSKNVVQSKRE